VSIFSIKPTRQDYEPIKIVSDLDALVQESIAFTLFGERHILKPVTLEQFFKCTNLFAEIDGYMKQVGSASADLDSFLGVFHKLVSQVCETMTIEIVKKMSLQQVAALIGVVMDQVSGKASIKYTSSEVEKKNGLMRTS